MCGVTVDEYLDYPEEKGKMDFCRLNSAYMDSF